MVAWNEVQQWNAAEISYLAKRVFDTADAVGPEIDLLSQVMGAVPWQGEAADAARSAIDALHSEYTDMVVELDRIGRCVRVASDRIYPLVSLVRDCEAMAVETSMKIDSAGNVVDGIAAYMTPSAHVWEQGRERLRVRRELAARVLEAVRRATELDEQTATVLACAVAVAAGTESAEVPASGTPATYAAFWDSLTQADKTSLLVNHPQLIGNRDGIPADVRDAANRRMLTRERTRLDSVARELERSLQNNIFGGVFDNADAGLAQTRKRLDALDAITTILAQGHRQLLVLDNEGSTDSLAAIAVGNVSTATHVAVFVPGLDSDVQGDLTRYDGDMDSLKNQVEQQLPAGSKDTVACVTWMNYQAPHLGWSLLNPDRTVLSPMAAAIGAPRLTAFLDGLDASRAQDPHLSLLGHSYGSLTAALALRGADTTGVDEMVALGSPGFGVDRIDRLSIPPGHLFVGEAADDLVADLGVFGGDPSWMDGALPLSTAAYGELTASSGHGEYLQAGTTSQHNIALVVSRQSSRVNW